MKQETPQKQYPIDAVPFEAFYQGSWHGVNIISIKNGCISVQLNYHGSVVEDTVCVDYIRVRSRKARAIDCLHVLKVGVDVCVLSTHPITDGSDEESPEPLQTLSWVDAKIMSIKKDHNEGRCACQFSVILNRNKNPTSFVNCASHRVAAEVVNIDRIAILQKLHHEPCEDDVLHHWASSVDWTACKKSKLLTGEVSSEVSWLVVYSILKGMDFDVKLVQDRIVYHILNYVEWSSRVQHMQFDSDSEGISSSNPEETINVLSFRKRKETLKPKIETLFHVVVKELTGPNTTVEENLGHQPINDDSDVEILYDYVNLRRSKRQKVLPDRFTSYSEPNFNRVSNKKTAPDLNETEQSTAFIASVVIDEEPCQIELPHGSGGETSVANKFLEWLPVMQEAGGLSQESMPFQPDRTSEVLQTNLADENDIEAVSDSPAVLEIDGTSDSDSEESYSSVETEDSSDYALSSDYELADRDVPFRSKHEGSRARTSEGSSSSPGLRTRTSEGRLSSPNSHQQYVWLGQRKYSKRKKQLSSNECKQLIEKFMRDKEPAMESHNQPDVEWTPSPAPEFLEEFTDFKWSPDAKSENEAEEHEDLWREMEDSLATLGLLEQKQKLDAKFFGQINKTSDNDVVHGCQHVFGLDEQVGMTCILCNYVCTEIRYVSAPMLQNDGLFSSKDRLAMDDLRLMGLYNLESDHPLGNAITSSSMPLSEVYDSVWSPVSDLRSKLHSHQKRAFEFMWRNIAGSLHPEDMDNNSENTGGCVISHSPGSGKTLSVITFLVSYLRLYPGSRPLVLAPKTAVYIWWKEFQKWGVSTPVHLIHPFESYKKEVWDPQFKHSPTGRRPNVKMMHVIDCLSKLKHWRENPGVLLMSYPAFFAFTFKESKFEYRRFMADILLNSPGLLILDEGHNPRSSISKLRKQLMKVNTDFRILLSGTLFQNNFEEYFNTLTLARPRFVNDVISDLDPRMLRKQVGRKSNRKERLARKLFVEEIGQKIESVDEEERREGFNLLNKTTNVFIDSHDGDRSDALPGLQIYTILLTSTDIQKETLTKLQNFITQKRCPLDLELLITVGSIHPWLIRTVASVDDYFNKDELEMIEKYKKSFSSGSKVKFLIDLVHKSAVRGERVLIFCHNIPPINYLVQLFEDMFGWSRGKEVLVLQGDQELFERARIMDKFNTEFKNKCRVLLASTLACAEGISLTAASRVVLLDSEWNHAKTRQAIARAFRPGQTKIVYVYRLLALDTWEEDKYNSNEWKAWLSKMIFLGEYISFTCSKPVAVPEDELLKELAEEDHKQMIQMILQQQD